MTLTDFLLARIAEDEAWANRTDCGCGDHAAWPQRPDCPDRVLAECEAKRRIVGFVSGWQHQTVEDCWYSCAATYGTEVENACCNDAAEGTGCDCGLEHRVALILKPLALPYADHDDYDESWRP